MHESPTPGATRRVALLIEEGFDDGEVTGVIAALSASGITVALVGPWANRQYHDKDRTVAVTSDLAAGKARAAEFDALVVPGGYAPDRMRLRHAMVDLVRDMMAASKPVAAICRGAQLLISAGVLRDRTLTCWPSISVDVKNAGGLYVDRPVMVDGNLITSRKAADVDAFTEALVAALV